MEMAISSAPSAFHARLPYSASRSYRSASFSRGSSQKSFQVLSGSIIMKSFDSSRFVPRMVGTR